MTLTDLMNHHANAVREGMMDLTLGRSDHEVKIGDTVEMLLRNLFAVKDAMLEWEWLGIDMDEWPPQRLDWEMYRIEHLAFASNMEASFTMWHPWHSVYSALRCMACQEWQHQHVCPICLKTDRNIGGVHNAWAYFDGCLTHLSTAPRCIGYLLNEDPLSGRGKSLAPCSYLVSGALSQQEHERLSSIADHHLHGTWRPSTMANALLDRLSWLVLQTRPVALSSFQAAVQKNPRWCPKYHKGQKIAIAPPPPIKFLDMGTKMGCYKIGAHIPGRDDRTNIFHPRFVGEGIPPSNTFHSVIYERLRKDSSDGDLWCTEDAWFAHSPQYAFHVKDAQGYIWGLPVIVPTCQKKLFALGPRKYVDIVTDTLHASSSDLLTWNTLVMIKLGWIGCIPREWGEITTRSLDEWRERDEKPPFLSDSRRGYAGVTPVALSRNGVPGLAMHTIDQYPGEGLGIYEDLESCSHLSEYVWSDWTTKTVQPMHIDDAVKAMIDQPVRSGTGTTMASSQPNVQSDSSTSVENKGSSVSVLYGVPPFSEPSKDVSMEASADKRSRESPDTTTKPMASH